MEGKKDTTWMAVLNSRRPNVWDGGQLITPQTSWLPKMNFYPRTWTVSMPATLEAPAQMRAH